MKRDEIADIIYDCGGSDFCYDAAGKIITSLTGEFEVVEGCGHGAGLTATMTCKRCTDGTIVRNATWEEVMEVLNVVLVRGQDVWINDRVIFDHKTLQYYFILKDGARLRVKK